ncbi:MAG: hypothetical protein ACYSWU_18575, partial [Planctomycetota bacterium]
MKSQATILIMLGTFWFAGCGSPETGQQTQRQPTPERQPASVEQPRPDPEVLAAIERIEQLGGKIEYDPSGAVTSVDLSNDETGNGDLKLLTALPKLRGIKVKSSNVTDEGLAHLTEMTGLRLLALKQTSITDAGLEQLKKLPHLQEVSLLESQSVTAAGVA